MQLSLWTKYFKSTAPLQVREAMLILNMANISRRMFSACSFVPSTSAVFNKIVKRSLFSSEILGIENFKRISIFEKDKLGNKEGFLESLKNRIKPSAFPDTCIVPDLIKLIYVADKTHEVPLIRELLRKLYGSNTDTSLYQQNAATESLLAEGPLSPKRFQFGPLVFRLLYVLRDTDTALGLFDDKELKRLFVSTTCHLLLMDMLYESGRYPEVVECFAALQGAGLSARFSPDCTTLVMAALFQMNTRESLHKMKRLMADAQKEGCKLSRRSLLFAAALALRQGDALLSLDVAQLDSNLKETIFRNIKVTALARLGRLDEAVKTMQEGLKSQGRTYSRTNVIYSDTVQSVADILESNDDEDLRAKFDSVLSSMDAVGLLSPQTVRHFVTRPILRHRKPRSSQSFKTRLKSPRKVGQKWE